MTTRPEPSRSHARVLSADQCGHGVLRYYWYPTRFGRRAPSDKSSQRCPSGRHRPHRPSPVRDDSRDGGLSTARLAHEGDDLPGHHLKADTPHGVYRALRTPRPRPGVHEPFVEVSNIDDGRAHTGTPLSRTTSSAMRSTVSSWWLMSKRPAPRPRTTRTRSSTTVRRRTGSARSRAHRPRLIKL